MIISTTQHPEPIVSRGFTLVEVMVAVALSGFILAGVLTSNLQVMRSGVRITQYAEMGTQIHRGLELFGNDVKCATDIVWNNDSDITLTVPNSAGTTSLVTYAWSSTTKNFFRVPGASSAVTTGRLYLIQGIPAQAGGAAGLTFARFDHDGNAATTNLATKRIQITLTLSRQAQGMAATSENSVSATFVMRNKPIS